MYHTDLSVFIRVHPWLTAVFRLNYFAAFASLPKGTYFWLRE